MSFVDFLLLGSGFVLLLAFGTLLRALRRASDGHEDALGFHPGAPRALSVLADVVTTLPGSNLSPAPDPAGAESSSERKFTLESADPFVPKARRRSVHSRPPLLPANLTLDDFNPQPPPPSVTSRRRKKSGDSAAPLPSQSQFPFPESSS